MIRKNLDTKLITIQPHILPDLALPRRVNQRYKYSGMDSPDRCLDRPHFDSYPYSIEYSYNARGFRDEEWPDNIQELQQAVWCIGDSFTVGIGQPLEHIWPQILSERLGKRTINVSMDGASNDWIHRRAWDVIKYVRPQHVVIMWSYTHRAEHPCADLSDEARRIWATTRTVQQDYQHWLDLVASFDAAECTVVQSTIPEFHHYPMNWSAVLTAWERIKDPTWEIPMNLQAWLDLDADIKSELADIHGIFDWFDDFYQSSGKGPEEIIHVDPSLDLARDGHHFDILTARWFADQVIARMT